MKRRAPAEEPAIETNASSNGTVGRSALVPEHGHSLTPVADPSAGAERVLIAGYYGHDNLGDEAILEVMLAELRKAMPNLSATVVSGNPVATRERHAVDAVDERDWPGLIDAAAASDLVILGGGGIFHDHFGVDEGTFLTRSHWGLTYFAAFPALAALLGRPFMLYAVGVGPLHTTAGERYTRLAFERADRATVRDPTSHELARSVGVDARRIETTADPAFLLDTAPPERVQALLRNVGIEVNDRRVVAVAVRHWDIGIDSSSWRSQLAAALDRLVTTHGVTILFVPFQQSRLEGDLTDDRAAAARIRDAMKHAEAAVVYDAPVRASEVQGIFAAADLVVAMRLHGVILAANAGTPIMALAYDPKVRHAMDQLGQTERVMELASATSEAIFERAASALEERDRIRLQLETATRGIRASAARDTCVVLELLRRRPSGVAPVSPEWTALFSRTLLPQTRRAAVHEAGVEYLQGRAEIQTRELAELGKRYSSTLGVLEERTRELAALGADLATLRADLEWRPEHTYRRMRRATRTAVREAWRHVWRLCRVLGGPPYRLGRRTYETVVPGPARAALYRTLARPLMGWAAYSFDRYKRSRAAVFGADLGGLRAPGDAGLVSIVLPTYNDATLMCEAIDSVLAQTYSQFELIVVDDGSTDETSVIVDRYARTDARVRVIHQDHCQLPRALSRGFRLARGEFLTWTSSDNRLKPTFLAMMVDCLRRHPDWDATYANLDIIGEDGSALKGTTYYDGCQHPPGSEHIFLPPTTAELNVVPNNHIGAGFLYRSRVAHLIGDYSPFRFVMEDYDYWMRVNALMSLRHADFDEPVYEYRFHRRSLTSRWDEFGMLRNRERLMVFDDFRRDFYLAPLVWILDGHGTALAGQLAQRIRDAGHVLFEGGFSLGELPRLGIPVVYAVVSERPDEARVARDDLPEHALKVLLAPVGDLPRRVSQDWDLCCAVGTSGTLPRLSGAYQGWLSARDAHTLFAAVDIRAKSAHLERIEMRVEAGEAPSLQLSVVICARGASARVVQAIRSVAAQTLDTPDYEVIVVSNDPRDSGLREAVDELRSTTFAGRSGRLRFIVCPIAGLSAARNAGLAEADGEVVCFLDDDAVAAKDWLAMIWKAFVAHPSAGVIGGHIALKMPEPRPSALAPGWEKYWSQLLTEHKEYVEVRDWRQFPWGANWSARRAALRQIGGFRTRYGRVGDNFWGGEELVAACLVRRLGYTIGLAPDVVVSHDVSADRFTFEHVFHTIAAGHQVGHSAQRDLYLPMTDGGPIPTLRQIFTNHVDRAVERGRYRWVDAAYRKSAQLHSLADEIGDLGRRARTPIVGGRS